MIVQFTEKEKAKLDAIDEQYTQVFSELVEQIKAVEPTDSPKELQVDIEYPKYPENPTKTALAEYKKKCAKVKDELEERDRIYKEWYESTNPKWRELTKKLSSLMDAQAIDHNKFYGECERRAFNEISGSPESVIASAKQQVELMVNRRYERAKKYKADGRIFQDRCIRAEVGGELYVDIKECIRDSKQLLALHYDYFKDDPDGKARLDSLIIEIVTANPRTSSDKGELFGQVNAQLWGDYTEEIINYDVIPSSSGLYALNEMLTYHGKERVIETTKGGRKARDRKKQVEYLEMQGGGYQIKQKNTETGETIITGIASTNKKLRSKGVKKCLAFLLAQSNYQNFNPVIGFSLQDVVDRNMYSSLSNARRGVSNALDALQMVQLGGTIKKGKKTIEQAAGILYYHYDIKDNFVKVWVNENFNIEFMASFFALLPKFSYGLTNGDAFDLCEYIFLQARSNKTANFKISFRTIRERLALPTAETYEGNKFKPKQYVIDPILNAIADIQRGAAACNNGDIVINIIEVDGAKGLEQWLNGYIEITLTGEITKKLNEIDCKQRKKIAATMKRFEPKKQN